MQNVIKPVNFFVNFFVNAENILRVFHPLSHLGGKHPDEVVQPVEHLLKSINNQRFKTFKSELCKSHIN